MTDRDEKRTSFSDDDFDDFLAEFASVRTPAQEPSAPRPRPPSAQPTPASAFTGGPDRGVDVSLDFDDDDDGATRVGQIPLELLAALGRKPAEEHITQRPPAPDDEIEVSMDDDFGGRGSEAPAAPPERAATPSVAPELEERTTLVFDEPPPPVSSTPLAETPTRAAAFGPPEADETPDLPVGTRGPLEPASVVAEDDEDVVIEAGGADDSDEVVIDAGDDEPAIDTGGESDDDEVVIDASDDEPYVDAGIHEEILLDGDDDRPTAHPAQATEAPPVITLEGRARLAARAAVLAELAAASEGPRAALAFEAAADLAERAGSPEAQLHFERAGTAFARRSEVRRGTRALSTLAPEDLGPDVAAARALRSALAASRRADSAALIAALEDACRLARLPGLRRFASLELAGALDRAGEATRATEARLQAVVDTASPGTLAAIARAQLTQSGPAAAAETLERAARGADGTALGPVLARWSSALSGRTDPSKVDRSTARAATLAALARDARSAPDQRVEHLRRLAANLAGEARGVVLTELGAAESTLGNLEVAAQAFAEARSLLPKSALVDAVRDAEAQRLEQPDRLPPTPAQDDEQGPLAILGRALAVPEVGEDVVAKLLALRGDPRVGAALAPVLGDIAANVGDPNTWVEALLADTDPHGAAGRAITRALVLARAGDLGRAIDELSSVEGALAGSARAVLAAASAPELATAGLLAPAAPSLHARALAARLAPRTSVDELRALLEALPHDAPLALRLEQTARAAGHATATAAALETLAGLTSDEVDQRKLHLLAAAGGDAARALELAPDDPLLLAEALLDAKVAPAVRDRAIATLSERATPIVTALLHARAATLAEIDGSPADAALQLRAAHDAVPNEPSLRVSVELAELAAEQPARIAHRLFSVARDEGSDARTRARAFARLAELDLHERNDPTAAIASLNAVLDLAPAHVPSLRSLEAIAWDRADTEPLAELEAQLATALAPGAVADAHARQAVRLRFARGAQPSSDTAPITLAALERRTRSTRLLRWAEHAARYAHEGGEIDALERRLEASNDPEDHAELGLRIASYAQRRGNTQRAIAAIDAVLELDPAHPAALLENAFLRDLSEDSRVAADAHEAAARSARSDSNALRHYVRAAEHRAAVLDHDGARAALEAALARSPDDPDVLAALVDFHERRGELDRALELVERRLSVGVPDEERARWHRRRATLGERSGNATVARAAYLDLLPLQPDDVDVLRRVAVLSLAAEDGPTAIDAYMRLARLQRDPAASIEAFLGLGECYGRLVPDARRSEASYRRVIQLDPAHELAHTKLAALLVGHQRYDDALALADALEQAATSPRQARTIRLDVARACEKAGDFRAAETLLDGLRRTAPTDVAIQLELARFFADRGGGPPLSMHLNRAVTDLRRAFEEHPSAESLLALLDIQGRRGRADALACFEAAAATLGIERDHAGKPLSTRARPAHRAASSPDVDSAVAPRSLPDGTRAAMRLGAAAIDHVFPFDARAFQAEKLPKESPIRTEALSVAHWFGFDDVQLMVTPAAPRICVAVSSTPLTIVIGRELPIHATEAERAFLFARAAKIASAGMSFAVRMQPAQVALAVHALVHAHDPSHAPAGVDPAALAQASQSLARHLAKGDHELGPLCIEMGTRAHFEPARFGLAAAELGDRVALLATGDVLAGVGSLLRLAGRDLDAEPDVGAKLAMVRAMPEAWGLLLFALSDAYAEARQRAGVTGG